ncbi:hypothetical protein F5B22DRAFT_461057 [Xylaria bambusicola]|uniref:uncharacterized protein n=1 Tax=Xylaria bambusicola TaxID=326684 RepID=UPI0020079B33|nr:uncharacterized protein F5B22DRAFT_461057 [Xylaria bambusicola]KAI0522151.1 hypothetical protein F5B22DRAFT_461057 [Xylaria bambusicola]
MSGKHRQSTVLADASNRANISIVPPVTVYKTPANSSIVTPMPSSAQLMAVTGANRPAPKPSGPAAKPAAAPIPSVAGNAPKTAAVASKKRKAETTLEEDIAAYKQNLDHIISPHAFEDDPMPSCNAVRGKINKLLDSGIMNKAEFAKVLGSTNANTLNRFLHATGPMGGSGSSMYYNAWVWFKQREYAKIKMPDVKKRQKLEVDAATAAAGPSNTTTTTTTTTTTSSSNGNPSSTAKMIASSVAGLPDISGIHLEGEETDDVPVYDTCDDIRKKINAHLKTPGLTQTQFCRDIYAQLRAPKCKGIQSKQLADFRALKGANAGAKSSVFYAAYCYFEKLRVAQGKPKTAHRLTMETLWAADGGFDRENDHRTTYFFLGAGDSATIDQYGRMG